MIVFALGAILLLLACGLMGLALRGEPGQGTVGRSLAVLEAMTTAPKEMSGDLEKSFEDRVLTPLRGRALAVGRRFSGAGSNDRIQHKLDLAGNPREWSVDRVISLKVMAAAALLAVGVAFSLLLGLSFGISVLVSVGGLVLGFFVPNFYLYQTSYDRAQQLQRELADAVDLLTISVEAGLGFDAAVQQVARNTDGPLGEELSRMLREMQLGTGRGPALRALADRTSVPEVKSFVGALVQADAFGIPIASVLRVQSSEMRVKRRQRAEERAQQVPVKITVPLILFILPTLFIAVMGPAVISVLNNVSG